VKLGAVVRPVRLIRSAYSLPSWVDIRITSGARMVRADMEATCQREAAFPAEINVDQSYVGSKLSDLLNCIDDQAGNRHSESRIAAAGLTRIGASPQPSATRAQPRPA
jgi:hypothetical protein